MFYFLAVLGAAIPAIKIADFLLPPFIKKAVDHRVVLLARKLQEWKDEALFFWTAPAKELDWGQVALSMFFGALTGVVMLFLFSLNLSPIELDIFRGIILKYFVLLVVGMLSPFLVLLIAVRNYWHYLIWSVAVIVGVTLAAAGSYATMLWWIPDDEASKKWLLDTDLLGAGFIILMLGYSFFSTLAKLVLIHSAEWLLIAAEYIVRRVSESSKGTVLALGAIVELVAAIFKLFPM